MVDWSGASEDEDRRPGIRGEVEIIGSKPEDLPYLRIEDGEGKYIGSIDGATLYHLKNALVRALGRVQKD